MTRINLIPVTELHNKHLVAEYRELPRVYGLARRWYLADGDCLALPRAYTMGEGHVRFFYNKLKFIHRRQVHLHREMLDRGYEPQFSPQSWHSAYPGLWNDYEPTPEALAISHARIRERLLTMKS